MAGAAAKISSWQFTTRGKLDDDRAVPTTGVITSKRGSLLSSNPRRDKKKEEKKLCGKILPGNSNHLAREKLSLYRDPLHGGKSELNKRKDFSKIWEHVPL